MSHTASGFIGLQVEQLGDVLFYFMSLFFSIKNNLLVVITFYIFPTIKTVNKNAKNESTHKIIICLDNLRGFLKLFNTFLLNKCQF